MTFTVKYACPHCGRRIPHRAELAGQGVTCSACGGTFIEPTDPQPGKEAERMPKPLPEKVESAHPAHDYSLALMSNAPGSGMQTMQEVFDAQVIDDKPPMPQPAAKKEAFAWPPSMSPPTAPPANVPPPVQQPSQQPKQQQPARSAQPSPPASNAIPYANRPGTQLPAAPKVQPTTHANSSQSAIGKAPIPVAGLAGITPQQMLDELGRRGLVCVLLVHDYSEDDSAQIKHTQHLNTTQAVSTLAEFLLKIHQSGSSEEGKAGMLAAVKRLWSGDEDFLQAAGRLWNK